MKVAIENPKAEFNYLQSKQRLQTAIEKIALTFSSEYKIISRNESDFSLLITPVKEADKLIVKDELLHIELKDGFNNTTDALFYITNEDGIITSYSEQQRDEKALNIFTMLLQQELDGSLDAKLTHQKEKVAVAKSTESIMQTLILIASLVGIFLGMKACTT